MVDERSTSHPRLVRLTFPLLTGLALVVTPPAHAEPDEVPLEVGYDYGEFAQPRGAAMGGAIRAFGNSLDALYSNPANVVGTRVYHLGGAAQFSPTAHRSTYGAGIVDSVTSRVGAGIGGQYFLQTPEHLDRSGVDLRVALAVPVSDLLRVGVLGRHLWLKEDGRGPLGPSRASAGLQERHIVKAFSFDAGVTLLPVKGLAIAVVGQNLTNADHGFLPLTAGGGIGFGTQDVTVEADAVADFRTWERTTVRAMGGFEFLAADHYPLRVGYRFDQGAESHAACAGIGYLERAFSASVSLRQVVAGDRTTTVFLGFEYHLESTDRTPTPADGY
ncbi:MAG: hypothetical protein JW751_32465 [Polyangiaceae bacterium]|nr:hypothetical protein [Polyangiaceae bacterium]